MSRINLGLGGLAALVLAAASVPAHAQSFRVQCPTNTITHPAILPGVNNNVEPAYAGPTNLALGPNGYQAPTANVNGAIKCQQISGGDGYATMGDGTQTYIFSFGPLSGLGKIAAGQPGTGSPSEFNMIFHPTSNVTLNPGYPTALANPSTGWNGAIGLIDNSVADTLSIYDIFEGSNAAAGVTVTNAQTVTVVLYAAVPFKVGDTIVIGEGTATSTAHDLDFATGTYVGSWQVSKVGVALNQANPTFAVPGANVFQFDSTYQGLGEVNASQDATVSSSPAADGKVDPRQVMDVGVMNGNIPAPLMAIDEDDEFFLTLTNVGMIMRPDLFEQHTVHFHGYPNASAFYDGVPDASVAINIGGSFTYYYLAPDAGTYFWHCHITPPEHLQMGMVGQLYVRPRQNRWVGDLYAGLQMQQYDLRTACNSATDVLCSNPLPAVNTAAANAGGQKYAYNDGDGSTAYDVEYPLQMHGFDPNFHFVGMTFNPEGFADMKDKYFLLNGRSYPDTVTAGPLHTASADGVSHFSQPMDSIISIPAGKKALLRISELNVSEYHTLASLGIPMHVVGYNAKLLRDQAGNNMDYYTNSITLGGGESLDVILDASNTTLYPSGSVFYLYTPQLDHLSNDAENFGGQMTEVRIN
jgi:hypothetical protein